MDQAQRDFVETFRRFLNDVVRAADSSTEHRTPLGAFVSDVLGTDATLLPVVTEQVVQHRLADTDIALELLSGRDPEASLIGASGGQIRDHEDFAQLLKHGFVPFDLGPVDYLSVDIGPDATRQVVSTGIRLFRYEGSPVAILQRAAKPRSGRETASVEVLALTPEVSGRLLAEMRRLMAEQSVLRGQVISFTPNEFGHRSGSIAFLERPAVGAESIVLVPGALETIAGHVVEIGAKRERLRENGQHLKRGVLLYGPPGTGKTLTVRHLISVSEDATVILLTGPSISFITEAAELARAMQPAIVVLEDVDLIANERGMYGGPQPLLFAILDALDGLDGDADVAFVLTTNRADVLEPALAQRPGRIDLAVEIPLPDRESRRRLFRLYASALPLSDEAVEAAADRAEGVTGSFAKELMRRTVLRAAQADREITDEDLAAALDELLSSREQLTRVLLGGEPSDASAVHATHPPMGYTSLSQAPHVGPTFGVQ